MIIDFERELKERTLPAIADLLDGKSDASANARQPGSVCFACPAKHYADFYLGFRYKRDGKCRLTFFARFPDSDAIVENYIFEAGDTLAEIAHWLRTPECAREVLNTISEFDERIAKNIN